MKAIKRTVAALLATLMLATSTSFTLAATDDVELAVEKVNAAGIMTGTDKGFEPEKSLTRAEAAAIIVRMKGITEATVKAAAGTTNFDDVAATHWAAGYINQASNLGIVKGVSATSFAPDKEVTVQEMVTMAVRALGAGTLVDSEGTWPANYINFAAEEGILDGVAGAYASVSTRLDAARVVANCLEANMWVKAEADTNSKITYKISGNTILNDVLGIDFQKGMVIGTVNTKDRHIELVALSASDWARKDAKDYTSTADISNYDVTSNVNLAVLKSGKEVDVWFKTKTKEVVGVWGAENSKQTQVAFTKIVKDDEDNKVTLSVNGSDKKYTFAQDPVITYNEAKLFDDTVEFDSDDTLANQVSYTQKGNVFGTATVEAGNITALYLEEYTNYGVVKKVQNDKVTYESDIEGDSSSLKKFDFDDDNDEEYVITKDGKEVSKLEAGDAIEYYAVDTDNDSNDDKWVINVLTNTVEGTVVAKNNKYIKIEDKKYDVIDGFTNTANTKDEITAWLNENGKIVMFQVDEEATDSSIAVVTYFRAPSNDYGDTTFEVKLTTLDGSETEALEIDKVKSYDKLSKITGFLTDVNGDVNTVNTTAVTTEDDKEDEMDLILGNSASKINLLGYPVRYSMNSGKVVLMEVDYDNTIYSAYTDAKLVVASGTVDEDNNKVGTYKVKEDTAIMFVDATAGKSYEADTRLVDFADIKDGETLTGYAIDVDKDTNAIKTFINLDYTVKKEVVNNYAVVKSIAESAEDDEIILELFTADGVKEVAAEDDRFTDLAAGQFIQYADGDVIEDIIILGVDTTTDMDTHTVKFVTFNDGSAKYVASGASTASFLDTKEDLIVLTTTGTLSTLTGLKAGNMPTTEDAAAYASMTDAKECLIYTTIDTKTSNEVIAAIIYVK